MSEAGHKLRLNVFSLPQKLEHIREQGPGQRYRRIIILRVIFVKTNGKVGRGHTRWGRRYRVRQHKPAGRATHAPQHPMPWSPYKEQ